ncbi:hypothetical protein [Streptomyces sp. Wb2n-11]|uniref:hypothetical protein n=1 Tax=Streptomyces sp. Wb2n-11 TaxID=1030533 RepID=UPI000AC95868|nr:hypothetical protein [Streptomyces sp. Wb2n-11]
MSEPSPPPATPSAYGVRIDAQPGHASITLDGHRIPQGQVAGYTLQHSIPDALPTLVLHTRQSDGLLWEGIARVAVATEQDPGEAIAAFLGSIDPTALSQAALNRNDLDGTKHEITRAILQQLADWAQGSI